MINSNIQIFSIVAMICVIISFFIAKSVVLGFEKLARTKRDQQRNIDQIRILEKWQQVAKMLIHEIRNPLTPIKMINSKLLDKNTELAPEEFRNFLKEGSILVDKQVQTIEKMVDSFSKFGRLRSPEFGNLNFDGYLNKLVKRVESAYPNMNVSLECSDPQCDAPFDSELIDSVFLNIIKNASEANPEKDVRLWIHVMKEESYLRVCVINSGVHIPEDLLNHIFEPNFSSKSKNINSGNMGMGLAIARKIIADHGGLISVSNSTDPQGVRFEFTISCEQGEQHIA